MRGSISPLAGCPEDACAALFPSFATALSSLALATALSAFFCIFLAADFAAPPLALLAAFAAARRKSLAFSSSFLAASCAELAFLLAWPGITLTVIGLLPLLFMNVCVLGRRARIARSAFVITFSEAAAFLTASACFFFTLLANIAFLSNFLWIFFLLLLTYFEGTFFLSFFTAAFAFANFFSALSVAFSPLAFNISFRAFFSVFLAFFSVALAAF